MSNFRGPAHVTAALRSMLNTEVGGETGLGGLDIVIGRPSTEVPPANQPRITLFLYQVTMDPNWRMNDLPTRNSAGELVRIPRVAVNLHYLITFTGDETHYVAQQLMASTVRALHEHPFLNVQDFVDARNTDHALFDQSNIDTEVERVKFTPTSLSTDELTKLWTIFPNTPYELSLTYSAAVVFIERERTVPSPSLVLTREVHVETIGGGTLSPAMIPGLELWLRTDKGLTAAPAPGPPGPLLVSRWEDQSGSGRHAEQVTGGQRPMLVPRAIGSRPVLQFDGATRNLRLNWSLSGTVSAVTVCVVHRMQATGPQAIISFGRDVWELGATAAPAIGIWATGAVDLTTAFPAPVVPAVHPDRSDAELGGDWRVQFATYDASSTAKELWLGGLLVAQNTAAAAIPALGAPRQGTIGVPAVGGGNAFQGQVAEVMVFQRVLSAEERAYVFRYLNEQYGIA